MKRRIAKYLVIVAGRWIDASYSAWVRVDKGEMPEWYHTLWSKPASLISGFLIPIASRIDRDATGAQMVEEGWWG